MHADNRFIDGSEMVPTYGAAMEEIRGFVVDGWAACKNKEGIYYDLIFSVWAFIDALPSCNWWQEISLERGSLFRSLLQIFQSAFFLILLIMTVSSVSSHH